MPTPRNVQRLGVGARGKPGDGAAEESGGDEGQAETLHKA